jgi:hypothetical protein
MCPLIVSAGAGLVAGYTDPTLQTIDETMKAGDAGSSGDVTDAKRQATCFLIITD